MLWNLLLHGVHFAQARLAIGHSCVDLALAVQGVELGATRLHVEAVIEVRLDA